MGILRENRRAGKAKEHSTRKGVLDCQEHTAAALLAATRHTAVTLVYDEHHALVVDFCNGGLWHMVLVCDTTHLLYRGDDKILASKLKELPLHSNRFEYGGSSSF